MLPKPHPIAIAAALAVIAGPADAYIGPGAGLGMIAAFWSLVVAVVSSLVFLALWPLRHRLRRRKAVNDEIPNHPAGEGFGGNASAARRRTEDHRP